MIETHPDRFYDFFLELEYIKTDEKVRSVGIQVFDHILKDCLRVLKDCPYPNLRAHYTDYRMMLGPDLKEILVRLNQLMDLRDSGFKIVADPYYDKENLEQMMADLISRIRQFVESDPKLIKTTSNIAENNLVIFIFKIMDLHVAEFTKLVAKKSVFSMDDKIETLDRMISICSAIMDAYMLGRMFKTYDVSKNPTHPEHADNCVVYVGENHALIYRIFLKRQGFEQTIKIQNQDRIIEFTEEQRKTSVLFN